MKKTDQTRISDRARMVEGKLYNAASKDIFRQHALGFIRCDRFNKIDEGDRMNVWETYLKNETPVSARKKEKNE